MRSLTTRPDVAVRNALGNPIVVVEVKNLEGLSPDIATQLHRNMAAHGLLENAAYFLLVSQDKGYLWRERRGMTPESGPLAQFPMASVVARYASWVDDGTRLRGSELRPVVAQWLRDLSNDPGLAQHTEPERSLAEVGFLDALRGGTVERETLV
jgi:hypothetical protein